MSIIESSAIKEKFIKGLELALQRLVAAKKKEDGELVISKNGKVIHVKARNL